MPKNVADASLHRIFQNVIPEHKKLIRVNRTNQVAPLGYFPLIQGDSFVIEALTVPDGTMYYAIDLNVVRAFVDSSWVTIGTISNSGFLPLPQGITTTVEATPFPPNGAIYYATDINHIRAYVNGVWVTVV